MAARRVGRLAHAVPAVVLVLVRDRRSSPPPSPRAVRRPRVAVFLWFSRSLPSWTCNCSAQQLTEASCAHSSRRPPCVCSSRPAAFAALPLRRRRPNAWALFAQPPVVSGVPCGSDEGASPPPPVNDVAVRPARARLSAAMPSRGALPPRAHSPCRWARRPRTPPPVRLHVCPCVRLRFASRATPLVAALGSLRRQRAPLLRRVSRAFCAPCARPLTPRPSRARSSWLAPFAATSALRAPCRALSSASAAAARRAPDRTATAPARPTRRRPACGPR